MIDHIICDIKKFYYRLRESSGSESKKNSENVVIQSITGLLKEDEFFNW